MSLIVDASVFVAAARASEEKHDPSRRFLLRVSLSSERVYSPSLVLPECAGAIARLTGKEKQAERIVQLLNAFPGLRLEPISVELADAAGRLAGKCRLRGSDACYVALALAVGGTVVTWDREMLQRGAAVASTTTPEDWLAQQTGPGA